ncbi:MAG TPA: VWA domain-containing protein, partial [Pyrinomonadaceae bacterium]|nr:VWA domain-containing protein [Pyrinomonadaceae bacterium]
MKKTIKLFSLNVIALQLVCAPLLNRPAYAQQPSAPPASAQDERVVVSSNEVILDAVVKDKKGRPVRDLTAENFEVLEDGVRQQIKSLRLVNRAPGNVATGAAGGAEANPTVADKSVTRPQPSTTGTQEIGASAVALVFDRLSPEARKLARDAALSYVGDGSAENSFVGVFNIDLSLQVVQPYTNNAQLLRDAISNTGSRSTSSYASTVSQVQSLSERQQTVSTQARAAESAAASGGRANSGGGQAAAAGSANAESIFLEMTQRSLEVFEMLERDQQGYATTNGLLAVVNSMR